MKRIAQELRRIATTIEAGIDPVEAINGAIVMAAGSEETLDPNGGPVHVALIHDGSGFQPAAAVSLTQRLSEDDALDHAEELLQQWKANHGEDDDPSGWSGMTWTVDWDEAEEAIAALEKKIGPLGLTTASRTAELAGDGIEWDGPVPTGKYLIVYTEKGGLLVFNGRPNPTSPVIVLPSNSAPVVKENIRKLYEEAGYPDITDRIVSMTFGEPVVK